MDRTRFAFKDLRPITIHFDGTIDPRKMDENREYTMELFFARPGDVVVAKIDLKNGAVAVVPDDWQNVVVTGHFAVYEPDRSRILPEYLCRVIQSGFFKAHLWRNKVGAEGRKEVKLDFFEAERIPIPALPVQRAILDAWERAQRELAATRARIAALEERIEADFLADLGLSKPARAALPKCFAVRWKDLPRWSVLFNQLGAAGNNLQTGKYPTVELRECLIGTTNGYCIKPVPGPTPHKMLKLSALQPHGLDLSETKYVKVSPKVAERFHLRAGDLLICRSVGSFDHIAKCALVLNDEPGVLFPDIIIRARFNAKIVPEYARELLQTSAGRRWFQQNARTAVGMWKIGGEDIANFPMPLPPPETQRLLVAKVAKRRAEIAALRTAAAEREQQAKADVEAMILGEKAAT
ncbi:MAG: hypothetical protein HRF50_06295 [Phycisphaerae bacterium]